MIEGTDLKRVIEVLNTSLATELVCVLRYKAHYFGAKGLNAEPVAAEFLEQRRDGPLRTRAMITG